MIESIGVGSTKHLSMHTPQDRYTVHGTWYIVHGTLLHHTVSGLLTAVEGGQ